jgi:hypothetical protein
VRMKLTRMGGCAAGGLDPSVRDVQLIGCGSLGLGLAVGTGSAGEGTHGLFWFGRRSCYR